MSVNDNVKIVKDLISTESISKLIGMKGVIKEINNDMIYVQLSSMGTRVYPFRTEELEVTTK